MTFEEIVRKPQRTLKESLIPELRRMGYQTVTKKGFIYAAGSIPVLLVAHLDTVHEKPVKTICYSPDGKTIMSPEGIGGDDRAGVYMILQIIKERRCHVLFCEDEECGGIGASAFVESGIKPEVNYIVGLDRRGCNDAVFYDCDNEAFIMFVTGFGFIEDFGSFSDISILAPELGIAAVNISAGYFDEHTRHEYVDMEAVKQNIRRVTNMVSASTDRFEYIEAKNYRRFALYPGDSKAIRRLKEDAGMFGIAAEEIELLHEYGYDPDDIEYMLNHPWEMRQAVAEILYDMTEG